MKYMFTCIVLWIAVIAFSVFSAYHVTNEIANAELLLQEAVLNFEQGNTDQTVALIQHAEQHWQDHKNLFGVLLYHDEIDLVQAEFSSLSAYAAANDEPDFTSSSAALITKLQRLQEMEWPYLSNIL